MNELLTGIAQLKVICFIVLSLIVILLVIPSRKMARIKAWKKQLNLAQHADVFHHLYRDVDGFSLSLSGRKRQDSIEYIYGEIEFLSFIALLSQTHLDEQTVFYDLGCGTGKAVVACAMVYPVCKSVGVELLMPLYVNACNQVQQLAKNPLYLEKAKKMQIIQGNILDIDLSDATLIFINATTFVGAFWHQLCSKLNQLPHLKTVITTSKAMVDADFTLIHQTQVPMSWGVAFAFIHQRRAIN